MNRHIADNHGMKSKHRWLSIALAVVVSVTMISPWQANDIAAFAKDSIEAGDVSDVTVNEEADEAKAVNEEKAQTGQEAETSEKGWKTPDESFDTFGSDMEGQEEWNLDVPEKLPADPRSAVRAVAKSQLGYKEVAAENSVKADTKASKYGALMGDETIAPWDAAFAVFALHFAGIIDMTAEYNSIPIEIDTKAWISELRQAKLLSDPKDSAPAKGDLVFLKTNRTSQDWTGIHAGIVTAVRGGTFYVVGATTAKETNSVTRNKWTMQDIAGYVSLETIAPDLFIEDPDADAKATDSEAAEMDEAAADEEAEEITAPEESSEEADSDVVKGDAEDTEKEEASAESEPAVDEAGYILKEQTLKAELVSAPGIGGKLKSLFTSDQNAVITLSGKMPEGAIVKAYPVNVDVPGQNVVTAYDITIYVSDENGEESVWQPEEALSVGIKDDKIAEAKDGSKKAADFNVYHMNDKDAAAKPVAEVTDRGGKVAFEADSFSIYIVSQDAETVTYEFHNGSAIYSKQVLENGDELAQPASPVKDGAVFRYWSSSTGGSEFTGFGPVTVDENNKGTTVKLYAVYDEEKIYITYYDQDGAVVQRDAVAKPAAGATPATEDTTAVLYTPKQNQGDTFIKFRYWTEGLANLAETNPPQAGDDGVISITSESKDIDLYPVVSEGHWIYFDGNKSSIGGDDVSVSYVAPKFVVNGEDTSEITAEKASTAGYTFAGWYTRKNGGEQIFDADGIQTENFNHILDHEGNLPNNPTLYAHWTPNESVNYTVIIWKQKLADDKNATDDEKTYDYEESHTATGTPGSTASPSGEDLSKGYTGFHLNEAKTDSNVKVKGNGSTIINVYYDRNLMTFNFKRQGTVYTESSSTSSGNYYLPNGNGGYTQTYLYYNRGKWYRNNSFFGGYSDEYVGKRYTAGTGWVIDDSLTMTGLYGQEITKYGYSWPSSETWVYENDTSHLTPMRPEFNANLNLLYNAAAGSSSIEYFKADVDGNYPNNAELTMKYGPNTNVGLSIFRSVFTGYHIKEYRVKSGSNWGNWVSNIDYTQSVTLNQGMQAHFERDEETLSFFNSTDGALIASNTKESVLYGKSLSDYDYSLEGFNDRFGNVLTAPEGMEFTGWYYDSDCKASVDFENDTMPAANLRIYAGWKKIRYKVDIDPNGGEIGMPVNDHATYFNIDHGESISEYADVTRDYVHATDTSGDAIRYEYKYFDRESGGDPAVDESAGANWKRTALYKESSSGEYVHEPGVYTFLGWFKVNADDTVEHNPYNFTNQVTEDTKLRAMWRRSSSYRIEYVTEDGVRAPIDKSEYVEGAHAIAAASDVAPAGKRFTGWKDSKGTVYQPNDLIEITEDKAVEDAEGALVITLTAQYANSNMPNGYMADYVFKKGEETVYTQTVASGETLVQPEKPTEEGKVFVGWFYDKEGKHRFDDFGVINQPIYTTLYAKFVTAKTVTYYMPNDEGDDKGDAIITTQTYAPGDYLSTLYVECPTDDDHMVDHWTDGTNNYPYKAVSNTIQVNDNLELYPILKAQKILRFDTQTDKVTVAPVKIPAQGWPALPTEPARAGYVFDGWWTEATGGIEYKFNETLDEFKTRNHLEADVELLYAHWLVDTVNPQKGDLTVMWYAQLPDGGHTEDSYELVSSKTVEFNLGNHDVASSKSTLDTLCGGDIYDVKRLEGLYSGDAARYEEEYMDVYFEKSKDASRNDPVFDVDDTGKSTLKVYFDRKVYKYIFNSDEGYDGNGTTPVDYSAKNNTITRGDATYPQNSGSGKTYYSIDVWLEKDVYNEWPVLDDANQVRSKSGATVFNPGMTAHLNGWSYREPGMAVDDHTNYLTAVYSIDGAKIRKIASKGTSLELKMSTRTSGSLATLRYWFDGELKPEYDQEMYYSTGNTTTNKGRTYYTSFTGKTFDGYEIITDNNEKHYCYVYNNNPRGEIITVNNGTETQDYPIYHYYIAPEWENTTFYNGTTHVGGLIFGRDVVTDPLYIELNSGQGTHELKDGGTVDDYTATANDYKITIGSESGTQKTSGSVYYETASGDIASMNWTQFTTEVIRFYRQTAVKEVPATGTTINFYYRSKSYPVKLIGYDGVTVVGNKTETYQTQMSGSQGKLESADYKSLQPTAPTGYEFDCWSTDPNTSACFYGTMPAHALTLYARYKPITVHVTTVGYDRSGQATDNESEYGYFGRDVNSTFGSFPIIDPTSPGKNFAGWYLMNGDTETKNFVSVNDRITHDIKVYPKFTSLGYRKLVYDKNGGDGTAPTDSHTYVVGSEISVLGGNGLTKQKDKVLEEGKYSAKFVCWNTKADGTGTDYYEGDWISIKGDDGEVGNDDIRTMTLYAQYNTQRESKLVYDLNAGTDSSASFKPKNEGDTIAVESDGKIVLKFMDSASTAEGNSGIPNTAVTVGQDKNGKEFEAVRPGYKFIGWATTSDATAADAQNGDKAYANTLDKDGNSSQNTLYAIWDRDTINFEAYPIVGGEEQAKDSVLSGTYTVAEEETWTAGDLVNDYLAAASKSLGNKQLMYVKIGNTKVKKLRYKEVKDPKTGTLTGYEWQYATVDNPTEGQWTKIKDRALLEDSNTTIKFYYQETHKLTVTNEIEGEYADMTRTFDVIVKLAKANNAVIDDSEIPTVNGQTFTKNAAGTELSMTVALGQDGNLVIPGVPSGWKYTITEDEHNGYRLYLDGTEGDSKTGTLGADTTVALKNEFIGPVVPSGIHDGMHQFMLLLLILALFSAGFVWLRRRKTT